MATENITSLADAPPTLSALAEHLRDGPLQQLAELQLQANELADRLADAPSDKVEDLERLVRLSLLAMDRFHAFTLEFAAVLRELTDANRHSH